jgi:hypothetical protein
LTILRPFFVSYGLVKVFQWPFATLDDRPGSARNGAILVATVVFIDENCAVRVQFGFGWRGASPGRINNRSIPPSGML